MGSVKVEDVAPGLTDAWRLWRHCLCRFGWMPILVAPLITCAAFMDLYSTTGCDFIRLDIGFVPVNEVWDGPTAHLGLFSYDSFEIDSNKWKRSFNNGCQAYSSNFESVFIGADQTWQITRIMAYISGCASIVAVATAWLLTITPLPASFFWPGVLLPAGILAMISGGAKFLFFDASICTEELWFAEGATSPVAPESCNLGDSAVYAIASIAAYFLCTIIVCIRSPAKRVLDPNYGNRDNVRVAETVDSEQLDVPAADPDPELGDVTSNEAVIHRAGTHLKNDKVLSPPSSPPQQIDVAKGPDKDHVRTTSDMTTWSVGSNQLASPFGNNSRGIRVLSPTPSAKEKASDLMQVHSNLVWDSAFGVFMTADDESRIYFEGKTQHRSNKYPDLNWKSPDKQQPLASSIRTGRRIKESDSGSVSSRISKVSFAETHFSEESFHDKASSSSGAPSVVSIPKKIVPSPRRPTGIYSNSSPNRIRYPRREDRNDVSEHPRIDSRRDRFEHLPRLDELASPRSNSGDHGDLINQCLMDLHKSFGGEKYGTL